MHDHSSRHGRSHEHHEHHHEHGRHHEHTHEHDHGRGHEPPREPFDIAGFARGNRSVLAALAVLLVLWSTFFTVRETEFALVTQFGRPVRTVSEAGLAYKLPFLHQVQFFDRRLRVYNPPRSEFLTRDKKNLSIDSYALWRIADPQTFLQAVGNEASAEMRLHDLVWAGLAASIAGHDLEEIISPVPEDVQAREMLDELTASSGAAALEQYGIRVIDVRLKRLNLPEQNKQSVYARMRAERERIARQYRAEGEEQALRIRAEADRRKEEILAKSYKQAETTRGEGDAEAARIYGQAYSRNPSFYKLTRTLETYRQTLDDNTTVILSSDSEFLRLLTGGR